MGEQSSSTALLAASLLFSGAAFAQGYGNPLDALIQQDRQLGAAISGMTSGIVQRNMQDPRILQMYKQHLARGGQLTFEQFAYQFAATGGFTPEGMANYRGTQDPIIANEKKALDALRGAERERGKAQTDYADKFGRNIGEAGNGLRGNSTFYNPYTGPQVLPHTTPNQPYRDPASGNVYVMDNQGQYFFYAPNGQWQPMMWAR